MQIETKNIIHNIVCRFMLGKYPADIAENVHLWLIDDAHVNLKDDAMWHVWNIIRPMGSRRHANSALHVLKFRMGLI